MPTQKQLTREVAGPTPIRNPWGSGSVAHGLTPQRLASILKSAADGDLEAYLTLSEEMEERDPHYSSVLRTRKLAVASLPVTVVAGSDDSRDQALAEDIQALIDAPEFGDLVSDSLDALGKGFSVCEILWDRSAPTRWVPAQYRWRSPRFFMFSQKDGDGIRLIDESDPANGVELPPYKFVIHRPRLKSGLAARGGLARLVAFSYICKMYGIKDWLGFCEIYGIPLRIGRYDNSATDEEKAILKTAVVNIGTDAAAILPESMQIEFEQVAQASGASEVFARLVEWIDRQVSKAVLGQTATTEGTPGKLGNEGSQEEVRQDLIAADAKQLTNTLNRDLIKPYIDLNYGVQKAYPRVVITVPEQEDLAALADNLAKLVPLGLKVSAQEVRTKLGLSEPTRDADLLGAAAEVPAIDAATNRAGAGHMLGCRCASCHGRALNQLDDVDRLEEEMLADWEPQIRQVTDPILAAVQNASSYEELIEALPRLLDDAEATKLIESLAKAGLIAYGTGIAS